MPSTLYIYLAAFIALTVQVVECTPVDPDNEDADYHSDINMETLLANLLTKVSLQQEDSDGDEIGLIHEEEYDQVEIEDLPSDTQYEELMEEQQWPMSQSQESEPEESVESKLDEGNGLSLATTELVSEQIRSGDTVAFKTGYTIRWVKFGKSNTPYTVKCPKLNRFMDIYDYTRVNFVFKIYRLNAKGKALGPVHVGDPVGIYYPEGNVWLGCAGKNGAKCYKTKCPGQPTSKYGFCQPAAISKCYGAVFKIYARGKKFGDIVTHRDDIFLYINSGGQYISYKKRGWFQSRVLRRGTCPGSVVPPPSKYEQCSDEIFSIWKKGLY